MKMKMTMIMMTLDYAMTVVMITVITMLMMKITSMIRTSTVIMMLMMLLLMIMLMMMMTMMMVIRMMIAMNKSGTVLRVRYIQTLKQLDKKKQMCHQIQICTHLEGSSASPTAFWLLGALPLLPESNGDGVSQGGLRHCEIMAVSSKEAKQTCKRTHVCILTCI